MYGASNLGGALNIVTITGRTQAPLEWNLAIIN
jgi:outer membrane receptor protein involved in Fe transport